MRVAIVHDWFVGGGAEKVVAELHKLYPEAPIFTSYCSKEWRDKLKDADIRTGYLQYWPFTKLRKFLPVLRILWFGRLKFDEYDLVISSSGAEAKGIKTSKDTLHVNYCHAPTHYYWSRYDSYLQNPGFGRLDPLARVGLKLLVGPLRQWDYKAAQRPNYIIANSHYTADQIKKYYGRESQVIHPPVYVDKFYGKNEESRRGYITAGRQTPYKRIDLAVKAFNELGYPLLVLGNGPQNRELEKIAKKNITFIRNVSDEQMAHYFQTSLAFIFPGIDDFGIVAVEALAAGTPVVAYKDGGALDYIDSSNGAFFNEQSVQSLVQAVKKLESQKHNYGSIATSSQKFSDQSFRQNISKFIKQLVV